MLSSASDSSTHDRSTSTRSFPQRQSFSAVQGRKLNVFAIVQRHWTLLLIVFFVIFGLCLLILWMKVKPVYDSQSVVYISPKFPTVLKDNSEVELPYDSYFQEQIQTVTRHDILEGAIASLPYSVRHRTGPVLTSEIERLQRDLIVKRSGTSYEMSIGLSAPSPRGLAETVNAVTTTYVERARNPQFYGVGDRLKTLNLEKQRLQTAIDKGLAEKAHLMEQLGVATTATQMGTDWRDNDKELEPLVELYQGDRVSAEYEGAPRAAKDSSCRPWSSSKIAVPRRSACQRAGSRL